MSSPGVVLPAMNVLWFWFDQKTRRALHGTPEDCVRKYEMFLHKGYPLEGLELFLIPARLREARPFRREFIRAYRDLGRRSVHIGDGDAGFLLSPSASSDLSDLRRVLDELQTPSIVIHAHHFRNETARVRDLLLEALPGVTVCIENNGFDSPWGANLENLRFIFEVCPEFRFCLDVAHVKDFPDGDLDDFLAQTWLMDRLEQIHWSCSTLLMEADPYPGQGHTPHGAYHGLFPACGMSPSGRTLDVVRRYPAILEGIVPVDDHQMRLLRREAEILGCEKPCESLTS